MKKTPFPDFTDKFVSVSIVSDDHTYAIDRPRFELQGDRWFLVGTVPRGCSNGDWCEGATSAVAWDQVATYLVFDSAKCYQEGLKNFKKYKKSKG
jgi:hypothetical protein